MTVFGMSIVVAKIIAKLQLWSDMSGGGSVTASQGAFVFGPDIRIPDIAYTPQTISRSLAERSKWTYQGEPFAPTFVVEVDKLSGEGSRRSTLDQKMRNEYFQHGVQLGWLIDPRPDHQCMHVYYRDDNGEVQCSVDCTWRDLDGGDVLPGFKLSCIKLQRVTNQEPGSSSEEEGDYACPETGCNERFQSRRLCMCHLLWHQDMEDDKMYRARRDK